MEGSKGNIPGSRRKRVYPTLSIFVCLNLFTSTPALAEIRQFIPRYEDFSGKLGVRSLYEQDKNRSNSATTKRSDLDIIESLNLEGFGYIFSPLFVSMKTTLGIGLEQEEIDNNGTKSSTFGEANSFSQEFKILPAHIYNGELYFSRTVPMTSGQAGASSSVVLYDYGARLAYNMRPWSHNLTWSGNDSSGTTLNSKSDSLSYNLLFFSRNTSFGGSYTHRKTSQNDRIDSTKNLYSLRFNHNLDKIRFSSWWTQDEFDENDLAQEVSTLTFATQEEFYGAVDFDLPFHVTTNLSYRSTNDDEINTTGDTKEKTFNNSERYAFRAHHRLFKSLHTAVSTQYNEIHSQGGDSHGAGYHIITDYTKTHRWGMVRAGLWAGQDDFDNTGGTNFLFERPLVSITDILTLTFRTVDPTTIKVSVIDHNDNDRVVELLSNEYQIIPNTDPIQIRIVSWPPANGLAVPVGITPHSGYAFQVDYALIPSEYELRTTSWGGSFSLPLFDNLITPFYSYAESRQKELEGDFPGNPGQSKAHSLGISFAKANYKGEVTRSWLRSNTSSDDTLRVSIDYEKEVTKFTSAFLNLGYSESSSQQIGQDGIPSSETEEKFYSAQTTVQTSIPQKNLTLSVSGSYNLYKGLGDSTTLNFFSTLAWHIGQTELNLRASLTDSESEFGGLTSERQYTSIRLLFLRELF